MRRFCQQHQLRQKHRTKSSTKPLLHITAQCVFANTLLHTAASSRCLGKKKFHKTLGLAPGRCDSKCVQPVPLIKTNRTQQDQQGIQGTFKNKHKSPHHNPVTMSERAPLRTLSPGAVSVRACSPGPAQEGGCHWALPFSAVESFDTII